MAIETKNEEALKASAQATSWELELVNRILFGYHAAVSSVQEFRQWWKKKLSDSKFKNEPAVRAADCAWGPIQKDGKNFEYGHKTGRFHTVGVYKSTDKNGKSSERVMLHPKAEGPEAEHARLNAVILNVRTKGADGKYRYLVQFKPEPGNDTERGAVLTSTIQASHANINQNSLPHVGFANAPTKKSLVINQSPNQLYRKQNEIGFVDVTAEEAKGLEEQNPQYQWVTLEEIEQAFASRIGSEHLLQALGAEELMHGTDEDEVGVELDKWFKSETERQKIAREQVAIDDSGDYEIAYDENGAEIGIRDKKTGRLVARHFKATEDDGKGGTKETDRFFLEDEGCEDETALLIRSGDRYLIQAKAMPGAAPEHGVVLTTSVYESNQYLKEHGDKVAFADQVSNPDAEWTSANMDAAQMNKKRNSVGVIDIPVNHGLATPLGFRWMTMGEIAAFAKKGLVEQHLLMALGLQKMVRARKS